MENEYSIISAIALNSFFGNNPKITNQFIKFYGSIEALSRLPREELLKILSDRYKELFNNKLLKDSENEYKQLKESGYLLLSIEDPSYPSKLKECPDAPFILYIRCESDINMLFKKPSVSIVGTRNMTLYGRDWTRRIVAEISKNPDKPLIVSGLAYGIDITAHLAALEFGLPTIGVIPVGINDIYPPKHSQYAERIVRNGGAIISDFPLSSPLYQWNFLRRNRIIAGLSDNSILVESKIKGGGLMTARLASEYSRGVFAVPGRIDDLYSQGCNELISKNYAACISSINCLSEFLGYKTLSNSKKISIEDSVREHFCKELSQNEIDILVSIVSIVNHYRGINIDELSIRAGIGIAELNTYLSLLEKEGFVISDLMQCLSINKYI